MIKILRQKFKSSIKDKDNKDLVKGGASAFVVKLIGVGFNYVFTFLIARGYGAAGSGIYAIFQTTLQLFSAVCRMGFDLLMMRSVAKYSATGKWGLVKDLYLKSIRFTSALSFFFSVILFFSSGLMATHVFLKPELEPYFKIAAFCILPLVVLTVHANCLRGMKKISLFAFLENVSVTAFASLMLGISFFFFHDKSIPLIAYLSGLFVTAIFSIALWWKHSDLKAVIISEKINFIAETSVAFTLFTTALLQIIRVWTEMALIGRFYSEEALGIYKVAFRISTITSLTLTAILLTVAPKIAELFAKGDIKKMGIVTQNATKIIFWTSAPVLILFILFPGLFLGIFGNEFKSGSSVLMILTIGQFINASAGPVSNVLIMTGKQKINRNVLLFSTVTTIVLSFIFVPLYGIIAAAVINVIGYGIINIVPFILVKYYYGFYSINLKSLFTFKLATESEKK